jgi:DnaJ-class molecular chaperone
MSDYYQILGVSSDATSQQIKTAFRDLAFKFHPDHCQDADGAEKMKSINEAYAVLSNPKKRQDYDVMRKQYGNSAYQQFRTSYSDQDIFKGSDIQQIFEEMTRAFGLRGFDEIFREFYGQGYQTFEFKKPGVFVKGFVFAGGLNNIPLLNPSRLKDGLEKATRYLFGKPQPSGQIESRGADIQDDIRLDADLAKTGGPYAYFHRKQSKKLIVKIPAGIRSGQKIRLPGMGLPGMNGGMPGDLFLKIIITTRLTDKIKDVIKLVFKNKQ